MAMKDLVRRTLSLTSLVLIAACADDPTPPEDSSDGPFLEAGLQVLENSGSTIVGTRHGGASAPDLVRFRPNLEDFQVLDDGASPWIELNATASPVEDRIVFQQGYPDTRVVEYVAGEIHPLTSEAEPAHQIWPQFTADGTGVVFSGGSHAGGAMSVYIVSAAGGSAELLWPSTDEVVSPSMSPATNRIAFVHRSTSTLLIVDLDADSVIASIDGVTMAKWSPVAERIAMIRNGELFVVNGDGSELRFVANGEIAFTPRNLAWAPDGAWVVINMAPDHFPWTGPLKLIDVDSGEIVTLIEQTDVSQATWGL